VPHNNQATSLIVSIQPSMYYNLHPSDVCTHCICDWVWENFSYLHTNFNHIFRIWSLITFSEHDIHLIKNFTNYAPITVESALTYRIVLAYPEKEIENIKHISVFCVGKTGFSRLSHILCMYITSITTNYYMKRGLYLFS